MLKMKHREEATSTERDEQLIREDERRRVMDELRGETAGRRWRLADHAAGVRRAALRRARLRDAGCRRRPADVGRPRRVATSTGSVRAHRPPRPILEQRPWVVEEEETVVERGFSPGQILIVLAGAASLALGIAAVAATGLDGPLSQPVDEVLGWNHTALLGIIEIGAGVVMILSGLRAGARWLGGLVGLAAIVGGALILGRLDWTMNELGAERDFGWVAIAIGAVAVIGAAIPRVRRRSRRTTQAQSHSC